VAVQVEPLVNCMIPVDAGTGGGGGSDAGTGGGGGGGGGGSTMTSTLPSVGANNTVQEPQVKTGCGCASVLDVAMPLFALLALRRRRRS
jgi:hypothetical protein